MTYFYLHDFLAPFWYQNTFFLIHPYYMVLGTISKTPSRKSQESNYLLFACLSKQTHLSLHEVQLQNIIYFTFLQADAGPNFPGTRSNKPAFFNLLNTFFIIFSDFIPVKFLPSLFLISSCVSK